MDHSEQARQERNAILRLADHARQPQGGPVAPELTGWQTPFGWFVCATHAAQLFERGHSLPQGCEPLWNGGPPESCRRSCIVCIEREAEEREAVGRRTAERYRQWDAEEERHEREGV